MTCHLRGSYRVENGRERGVSAAAPSGPRTCVSIPVKNLTKQPFLSAWDGGDPFVLCGMDEVLQTDWHPDTFIRDHGEEEERWRRSKGERRPRRPQGMMIGRAERTKHIYDCEQSRVASRRRCQFLPALRVHLNAASRDSARTELRARRGRCRRRTPS